MKINLLLIILILFLSSTATVKAQRNADIIIANAQVDGNIFSWEVHLLPTNAWGNPQNSALGDCSWFFEFNNNALADPILVYQAPEISDTAGYINSIAILGERIGITSDLDISQFSGTPLTQGIQYHLFTIALNITNFQGTSGLVWDQVNTGIFNALDKIISVNYLGNGNVNLQGVSSIESSGTLHANTFVLYPNYPNPFNPETTIRYAVPQQFSGNMKMELVIYNSLGRQVRILYSGVPSPGVHEQRWDGRDYQDRPVASGCYIVMLRAGEIRKSQKMFVFH